MLNRPGENAMEEVVSNLEKIAKRPQHFYNDTVVFLALIIAQARLRYDKRSSARDDVQHILWETALRLEDGDFAVAERNLQEIQKSIEESLRDGNDYKMIEDMMDQLQLAMEHYMRTLAEHLRQKGMVLPENMMTSPVHDFFMKRFRRSSGALFLMTNLRSKSVPAPISRY